MKHDPNSQTDLVLLRNVEESDLPVFFEHQRDPDANRMAAFSPRDRKAFMTHWTKILGDNTVTTRTILVRDQVAGNVVCFGQSDKRLVGYWVGKEFWGKNVATRALSEFLAEVRDRPLHAYVFKQNVGSIRVLEKCRFVLAGQDCMPASAGSNEVIEEFLYVLAE